MEMIENYASLCEKFATLNQKAQKALIETLNKRGVESINVKTYMDNDLIDWLCFSSNRQKRLWCQCED